MALASVARSTGANSPAQQAERRPQYSTDMLAVQLTLIRQGLEGTKQQRRVTASELVEAIRLTTEALVWGEKHDSSLFDLFCEHNALPGFVAALLSPLTHVAVRLQVLQSLSILVANARRDTTIYYLFSGGQINALLDGDPDLSNEEVMAYFIAFVKSLALRLDGGTALLFLQRRSGDAQGSSSFPLFDQAVRFSMHKEHMVSTAARTAILSLLGIDNADVRRSTVEAARDVLLPSLTRALRMTWTAAGSAVRHRDAETLRRVFEAEEDLLGFIGDLLQIRMEALEGPLVACVLAAVLPLLSGLAPPLAYPEQDGREGDEQADTVEQPPVHASQGEGPEEAEPTNMAPDTPEEATTNGSARLDVARAGNQLIRLDRAQQQFVGAVMDRILFGRNLVGNLGKAATNLLADQFALRVTNGNGQQPEEDGIEEPTTAAVAVRSAASCLHILARYQVLSGHVGKLLLLPSLDSSVVAAAYTPALEGEMEPGLASVGALFGLAPRNPEDASHLSVPIANPFRDALLGLLAHHNPVAPEAPLAAWALCEIHATCPTLRASLPSPTELMCLLRPQAAMLRLAQKATAAAILALATAPGAAWRARRDTASAVSSGLKEAAQLLLLLAHQQGDTGTHAVGTGAYSFITSFVEEWEWHQKHGREVDLSKTCGSVQCLLQAAHSRPQAETTWGSNLQRLAVRAVLTLRWLRGQLQEAGHAAAAAEPCPLELMDDLPSSSESGAASSMTGDAAADDSDSVPCAGPAGFGYTLHLHPTRLLVVHPCVGAGFSAPIWRVGISCTAAEPLRISFHIAEEKRVSLTFETAKQQAQVLRHLEDSRATELRRLLTQVEGFAIRASREASGR